MGNINLVLYFKCTSPVLAEFTQKKLVVGFQKHLVFTFSLKIKINTLLSINKSCGLEWVILRACIVSDSCLSLTVC